MNPRTGWILLPALALATSCRSSLQQETRDATPAPQATPVVANDDALHALEDQAVTLSTENVAALLLANDTHADGSTLAVMAVSDALHGSVALAGGAITFAPEPDFSGQASFVYEVSDENGQTARATVAVILTPVNDAPSFSGGPNQVVRKNADTQSVSGWATGMSAGPSDEATQTLAFEVTANSNAALFAAAPAISPLGELSYTPATDVYGTAAITLVLRDDGGVADGGIDTSVARSFSITVEPNAILAFVLRAADNPGLAADATGTMSGTNITIDVPYGTNVMSLVPTVTTSGGTLVPASGVAESFVAPVVYTATTASGSVAYTVTVVAGAPPVGSPLAAPDNVWTWVDFPDSHCDDGSTTGIGINLSSTSSNLAIFFDGGGACWNYLTCYVLNTSIHGPYKAAEFAADIAGLANGWIGDRTVSENPFATWNFVFVPYCTSDVHAGDSVTTYSNALDSRTYYHKGRANVAAYLQRLAATFPNPAKVAVTGSSAGGGGAVANYVAARAYWPSAAMYLIDDSLPFFEGNDLPASERTAWYASWNWGPTLDPLCGVDCVNDYSRVYTSLVARYPHDRMAVLSALQDSVISAFYLMLGPTFQTCLTRLTTDVLTPAKVEHFYVTGTTHTMLGAPANFTVAGMNLWTWLTQMVTDDSAWASSGP